MKDVNGEPIIGANVVVKGNPSNGTITDLNGNFDLSVTSNTTLQVSYIGYNTQELFVGKKTDFNIVLKKGIAELLDEYYIQYKRPAKLYWKSPTDQNYHSSP